MPANPQDDNEPRSWIADEYLSLESAQVTRAPVHVEGDNVGHAVEVVNDTLDQPTIADVRVSQRGDVAIPEEGDSVIVGYRVTGRPHVLGVRYRREETIPDFEPGERVVGHSASDAHIRLASDGTVHLEGDDGTAVEIKPNGDVVVDGGSTAPITDVDFTGETVTRADGVFVPSN